MTQTSVFFNLLIVIAVGHYYFVQLKTDVFMFSCASSAEDVSPFHLFTAADTKNLTQRSKNRRNDERPPAV